jgi:hypothetical protein
VIRLVFGDPAPPITFAVPLDVGSWRVAAIDGWPAAVGRETTMAANIARLTPAHADS